MPNEESDPILTPVTRQYYDENGNLVTVGYPPDEVITIIVVDAEDSPGQTVIDPMEGYTGEPAG